jgi:UDP-N-acetylmuramate--alanine ligase
VSSEYDPPAGSIPTLDVPNLSGVDRVHLVGIGGAGMSGIARLLLARGLHVQGSDLKDSPVLAQLQALGAHVVVGHDPANVGTDVDAVIVSSAIRAGNPELRRAQEMGLPVFARAQVLAALAQGRRTIAVAGTHGKTTTTSMAAVILDRAGLDPTFVIGGHLNESGSGAQHGEGDVFVAETDESDGSFLLMRPDVAIVTNIEEDHLDFYPGGQEEIERAFAVFAEGAGSVVACGDDSGVRRALEIARIDPLTYGRRDDNRCRLTAIDGGPNGTQGELWLGSGERVELRVRIPGEHNLLNAAAAVIAAGLIGVPAPEAARAVGEFTGVHRRFERRGTAAGATFVDDYAHHPTELAATLEAARRMAPRRLVAVFQPHRYSRTRHLWRELGESLRGADLVVVTDVYAAGEEPIPGVSGRLLVDALHAVAPRIPVVYLHHRVDVPTFLAHEVRAGDLVLTLGAGDVTSIPDETIELIEGRA